MLGYHLMLVILYRSLQLILSKTIISGDAKYHIWCSFMLEAQSRCHNLTCLILRLQSLITPL
jgi:hypothetical protein